MRDDYLGSGSQYKQRVSPKNRASLQRSRLERGEADILFSLLRCGDLYMLPPSPTAYSD